ncbi:MAG: hypothetical protein HQL41_10135 [Alphaproteobacteria bacterium]|nr:hypothetical protein [Alphaproteobacteria bacterium]
MDDNETKRGLGRREFLRRAGLGAGAAGVATIAAAAIGPDAIAAERPKDGGYAETEHVKRYYATLARF